MAASGSQWLRQAASDFDCAERLRSVSSSDGYCHIIAKYQQTIEKSIKAMAVALSDAGLVEIKIKYNHEVDTYIAALHHLPKPRENLEIQNRIKGVLNEFHRGEIAALISLAPRQPAPGHLASRNTEYPFQTQNGTWHIPSDEGVFQTSEIERFRRIADRIYEGAGRMVTALNRV